MTRECGEKRKKLPPSAEEAPDEGIHLCVAASKIRELVPQRLPAEGTSRETTTSRWNISRGSELRKTID